MYYNFSADGAKVKRSRKHSVIGDAKSAHLPETSSAKNSHIVQTFIHLAKFFSVQTEKYPGLLKKLLWKLLDYLHVIANQMKAGNLILDTALSTKFPSSEFRIYYNMSLIPSK